MIQNGFVKRLARTTPRVTQGHIYELVRGEIRDDRGEPMAPSLNYKEYWMIVDDPVQKTKNSKHSKGNKMLKIIKTTLIDGSDASNFSVDDLIFHIKAEEKKIANLEEVRSSSPAIDKIKKQHEANITALLEILDNKE